MTGQGHRDGAACSSMASSLTRAEEASAVGHPSPPLASSQGAKLLPPHCGSLPRAQKAPFPREEELPHEGSLACRETNLGSPSPGHSSFVAERSQGFGVKHVCERSVFCPPGTRPLVPDTPNHSPHFSPRRLAFQTLQHQASKSQYDSSCHTGRHREGIPGRVALGKSLRLSFLLQKLRDQGQANPKWTPRLLHPQRTAHQPQTKLLEPSAIPGLRNTRGHSSCRVPHSGPWPFPQCPPNARTGVHGGLQGLPRTQPGCQEVAFAHARPRLHGERPVQPNRRP